MTTDSQPTASKVPQACLVFWIIKIIATTLGETGGDSLSMGAHDAETHTTAMNLGYLTSSLILAGVFFVTVTGQILTKRFIPIVYWITIVATTMLGTTLADFADRSLGIGYAGGASLLLGLLVVSLVVWYRTLGSISIDSVRNWKSELFYWVTIMFSQTLGTALGDWVAGDEAHPSLGYGVSAILFSSLLAIVLAAYYWTKISRTALFWAAFILTRPLGAVVGDLLDKSHEEGGLELSKLTATLTLAGIIIACILIFPQRPATKAAH